MSYFVLFCPTQPATCLNLAPSMREKQDSTKYTGPFRKKLCLPFWTTRFSRNPNALLTTAVQSHDIAVTICRHPSDIVVTGSQSQTAARMSLFLSGGTAMTRLLPHSQAGPVEIIGTRITARRRTTAGAEILYFHWTGTAWIIRLFR